MTSTRLQRHLVLDIQGRNTPVVPDVATLVERDLVLRNRSDRPINVDIWIEPNDAHSAPLRQWCQLSQTMPYIAPGETETVILSFEVPPHATPGFYSYDVCAETPDYPGETERRSQQLEILHTDQAITLRNEPRFHLNPPSYSEKPYELRAGGTLTLQVIVENLSKRVDRLFLTCPELSPNWFDVVYPESNPDQPGQVTRTDGLQLNPDDTGTITLKLHPPRLTHAGHYSTTLKLTSANHTDLVLLDILYFKILVNDQITTSLTPKLGHIPGNDSEFTIAIQNDGNVERDLTVMVEDSDRIFRYAISQNPVILSPGATEQLLLQPHTRKWWRRQWRKRQEVKFQVAISDTPIEPELWDVPPDTLLAIPKPLDGKILWEAYPSWLRWLLKLIVIALLVAGAVVLAYWLLKLLVVDPRLKPQVLSFSTPKESYEVSGKNPIQLDFEVSNINQLENIVLTFADRDNEKTFELPSTPYSVWLDTYMKENPSIAQQAAEQDARPTIYAQWWTEQTSLPPDPSLPSPTTTSTEQRNRCQQELRDPSPWLGIAHRLVYRKGYMPLVLTCKALVIPNEILTTTQAPPIESSAPANASTIPLTELAPQPDPQQASFTSGTYEVDLKLLTLEPKSSSRETSRKKPSFLRKIPLIGLLMGQKGSLSQSDQPSSDAIIHSNLGGPAPLVPKGASSAISGASDTGSQQPHNQSAEPSELIASDSEQIKNIQLVPGAPPKILYFYSKTPTYRDPGNGIFPANPGVYQATIADTDLPNASDAASDASTTNADAANPERVSGSNLGPPSSSPSRTTSTPTDISSQLPLAPIKLNWVIDNPLDIESIKLGYILKTANGDIETIEFAPIPVVSGQIRGLTEWCATDSENRLICKDVPIPGVNAPNEYLPGEYTFTLTVKTPVDREQDPVVQETEPITIRSPYPEIISFTINDKEARDHPQQVHLLSPDRGSTDVIAKWVVANPDQVKVELLPAPGMIQPGVEELPVTIPATPGGTTITLQVTNAAAETVEQSVVISTAAAVVPTLRPTVPIPLTPPPPPTTVQVPGTSVPVPPPPNDLRPGDLSEPLQVPPSGN